MHRPAKYEIVAQPLFYVSLRMISNLKQQYFSSYQFYETDFMELVSSVHDPPKSVYRLCFEMAMVDFFSTVSPQHEIKV
jgi:hypothetical protein